MRKPTSRALLVSCSTAALVAVSLPSAQACPQPHPRSQSFDLQAHRGGLGMTTESSLAGFAKALQLGVSTLELDTQVTKDRKVVVSHDRVVSGAKCADTAPVVAGDPLYPYVGKFVKDLTLAQVKTLNCGYQQLPGYPDQEVASGAQMAELKDVFNLVKKYRARKVSLNIETKVEAGAPEQTQPRDLFVRTVWQEIRASGLSKQVTHQSFDWGALRLMHKLAPQLPLVALVSPDFLEIGQPGASPWLGGVDIDDFDGDIAAAAASIKGVRILSPAYALVTEDPAGKRGGGLVNRAHRRGLAVIPWTVDDPATMNVLIDQGVDGLITDYPNRLRELMQQRGMRLPKAYPAPSA